jgi:hypothetical protein
VQIFTAELQLLLSLDVEIHNLHTLVVTLSLARKLELRNQCATVNTSSPAPLHPHQRGFLPAPQRLVLPTPPPAASPTSA